MNRVLSSSFYKHCNRAIHQTIPKHRNETQLQTAGPVASLIKSRSVIRFRGPDTVKFLHGLLTNDIRKIGETIGDKTANFPTPNVPTTSVTPIYAALLTPQGRFLYDLFLYKPPNSDTKLDTTGTGPASDPNQPFELFADVDASVLDEFLATAIHQTIPKHRNETQLQTAGPVASLIKSRSVIRFRGPDTVKFLQGLLTNDIRKIGEPIGDKTANFPTPNVPTTSVTPFYAALLTPQGRFLYDLFLYKPPNSDTKLDTTGTGPASDPNQPFELFADVDASVLDELLATAIHQTIPKHRNETQLQTAGPVASLIKSRSVIRFRGPDTVKFLHGLLTNDIRKIGETIGDKTANFPTPNVPTTSVTPIYAALLTPQGRFLYDLFLYKPPNSDTKLDTTGTGPASDPNQPFELFADVDASVLDEFLATAIHQTIPKHRNETQLQTAGPVASLIKSRSVIRFRGPDTVKFLQGLLTNDIRKIGEPIGDKTANFPTPNVPTTSVTPFYAALLTPQGRFLYDLFLYKPPNSDTKLDTTGTGPASDPNQPFELFADVDASVLDELLATAIHQTIPKHRNETQLQTAGPVASLIKSRSVIRFRGPDTVKFLQGLLTNDIRKIGEPIGDKTANFPTPNVPTTSVTPFYAALLTPQGRLLYDLFLYKPPNSDTKLDTTGTGPASDPNQPFELFADVDASVLDELLATAIHQTIPKHRNETQLQTAGPVASLIKSRSVIRFRGPDTVKFLQGLLTNDIRKIGEPIGDKTANFPTPNVPTTSVTPIYAALLTPQGRLLYDLFLYKPPNSDTKLDTTGTGPASDPNQPFELFADVDASVLDELLATAIHQTIPKHRNETQLQTAGPVASLIKSRSVIRFRGPDTVKFLHGLLTNDIRKIGETIGDKTANFPTPNVPTTSVTPIYAALLTPQGRFLYDLFLYKPPNSDTKLDTTGTGPASDPNQPFELFADVDASVLDEFLATAIHQTIPKHRNETQLQTAGPVASLIKSRSVIRFRGPDTVKFLQGLLTNDIRKIGEPIGDKTANFPTPNVPTTSVTPFYAALLTPQGRFLYDLFLYKPPNSDTKLDTTGTGPASDPNQPFELFADVDASVLDELLATAIHQTIPKHRNETQLQTAGPVASLIKSRSVIRFRGPDTVKFLQGLLTNDIRKIGEPIGDKTANFPTPNVPTTSVTPFYAALLTPQGRFLYDLFLYKPPNSDTKLDTTGTGPASDPNQPFELFADVDASVLDELLATAIHQTIPKHRNETQLQTAGPVASLIKSRSVIRFRGPDTVKFLQGLLTNDIRKIGEPIGDKTANFPTPNVPTTSVTPFYAALLTPQARFLYDLFLYKPPNSDTKLDTTGTGPASDPNQPFELFADVDASVLDELLATAIHQTIPKHRNETQLQTAGPVASLIKSRSVIRFREPDTVKFLQGLLTNDIRKIGEPIGDKTANFPTPNVPTTSVTPFYAALLTPQGRFLYDLFLYKPPNSDTKLDTTGTGPASDPNQPFELFADVDASVLDELLATAIHQTIPKHRNETQLQTAGPVASLIKSRSVIRFRGPDTVKFLHGLLTNDIRKIGETIGDKTANFPTPNVPTTSVTPIYAALLTPQGRFLYDLFLYKPPNSDTKLDTTGTGPASDPNQPFELFADVDASVLDEFLATAIHQTIPKHRNETQLQTAGPVASLIKSRSVIRFRGPDTVKFLQGLLTNDIRKIGEPIGDKTANFPTPNVPTTSVTPFYAALLTPQGRFLYDLFLYKPPNSDTKLDTTGTGPASDPNQPFELFADVDASVLDELLATAIHQTIPKHRNETQLQTAGPVASLIKSRSVIRFRGPDTVKFLHGLLTNDIRKIGETIGDKTANFPTPNVPTTSVTPIYAALLTPQGRFLYDLFLYKPPNSDTKLDTTGTGPASDPNQPFELFADVDASVLDEFLATAIHQTIPKHRNETQLQTAGPVASLIKSRSVIRFRGPDTVKFLQGLLTNDIRKIGEPIGDKTANFPTPNVPTTSVTPFYAALLTPQGRFLYDLFLYKPPNSDTKLDTTGTGPASDPNQPFELFADVDASVLDELLATAIHQTIPKHRNETQLQTAGPVASLIKSRSVIRFRGPDTVKFLQGLLTNDIRKIGEPIGDKTANFPTPNVPTTSVTPFYAALLTPQGRFLYDLFLYKPPNSDTKLDTTGTGPASDPNQPFELFADVDASVLDELLATAIHQTIPKHRNETQLQTAGPVASLIKSRSVIRFRGPDTVKFLQGLLTNDIRKIGEPIGDKTANFPTPNVPTTSVSPIYAALLTPQGRFLYDLFLYKPPNSDTKLDTTGTGPASDPNQPFELFADVDASVLDELLATAIHQTIPKHRNETQLQTAGPVASLIKSRSVIRFRGPDTVKFLQGLLTNDIRKIGEPIGDKTANFPTPNVPTTSVSPIYAALLTPQGRFLYDLFLYKPPNSDTKLDTTGTGPASDPNQPFELFADVDASVLDELLATFIDM
ncbi:unnamed protein product [Trifolium pratense]|uniref:Uncharacterized protein n=1 Tax=Trifolium pratense TaxID=57577 RepID=A0ACB0KZ33_TRIPR|nr:unnamed protein product [Trifolium pratense]